MHLDIIEFFRDVVELGKARIEQDFEKVMEEFGWVVFEIEPTLALAMFEQLEEGLELVDVVLVTGDEVMFGEDDIELTGIGGAEFGIKKWYVDRKKQTAVVLNDFGLIGRCHQFFYRQRVDIEMFLEIGDVGGFRIFKINPGEIFVLDGFFHVYFFVSPLLYHRLDK